MDEIVMIPIEQLRHHPQNPRSDLGDLSELTESIKAQGILQNLTVIPSADPREGDDVFWVVIGNRRFEAAKAAGLTELPCKVTLMDLKQAMRTMMSENMQRTDLTMLDQIKGIGYMQQLGMSIPEIAQGTGLSEKTVRNRAKVGKLPKNELTLACEKGATLLDLLDVMQLESEAKRQEVLKAAGTNNFTWALNSAKNEEAKKKWRASVMPAILEKYPRIGEVPSSERYSGRWREICRSAWNSLGIREILALPYEQDRDKEETFEHELARRGVRREAYLLAWAVSGGICNECRDGWVSEYNAVWKECGELDETYALLERLGYEMSDFEKSLRDKTHEFFKEEHP